MIYTLGAIAQEAASNQPLGIPWWVIVGGWITSIALALIGQGFITKRAVNKHGTDEINMVSELVVKVDQMAKLQENTNHYADRRITLSEDRIDRLERTVYKINV